MLTWHATLHVLPCDVLQGRPLAFLAAAAAEPAASSGSTGALAPAAVSPSPAESMRQVWLPTPAVDEFRWTTKYLRSNQRLQEVSGPGGGVRTQLQAWDPLRPCGEGGQTHLRVWGPLHLIMVTYPRRLASSSTNDCSRNRVLLLVAAAGGEHAAGAGTCAAPPQLACRAGDHPLCC